MSIAEELSTIYEQNDGILRPEDVIEFAANPETALHDRFTWDDTQAAHQWRLEQARLVIRTTVLLLEPVKKEYRAFVSLETDRYKDGGYRHIEDVLTTPDWRQQLLKQARKEFQLWRAKYQVLKELEPVFAAMDTVDEHQFTNEQALAIVSN